MVNRNNSSERDYARQLFERAYEQHMNGEIEEAIDLYQQSIDIHPTPEAHTFLGSAFSIQRRYEEAISECLHAIALDETFGSPYNDIGAYLLELGRYDEAVVWLQRALQAPDNNQRAAPHMNLARVYTSRGDLIAALKEYKAAWEDSEKAHLPALHMYHNLLARLN